MFGLLLVAAAQASSPFPPIQSTGGFIAASVVDVDKSAQWYERILGVKIAMSPPENSGSRMIALEGEGMLIELIQDKAAVPLKTAAPSIQRDYLVHGIFKGGFLVRDWDGLLARLKALNVPIAIGPFPPTKEQRANLLIRDPDGNFIQFFGDYAPS